MCFLHFDYVIINNVQTKHVKNPFIREKICEEKSTIYPPHKDFKQDYY